jgi:ubiquinone/menaquinone biosynthesis C-methylase UbiE
MTNVNDLATLENYYNAISQSYDDNTTPNRWPVNDNIIDALKTIPHNSASLLDLGTGTGLTIETVMRVSHPRTIVAVDLANKMLGILKKKQADTPIDFVQSSVEDFIENDSREFDLVTAIGVLDFPENLPQLMTKLGRHITKDGLALFNYVLPQQEGQTEITYPSKAVPGTLLPAHCWQPAQINAALAQWGEVLIDKDIPGHIPKPGGARMRFRFVVVRKTSLQATTWNKI